MRRHEAKTRQTIARIAGRDPRTMSDREIADTISWWIEIAPNDVQIVFVMSGVLMRETIIRKACNRVGFSYERLVYAQLAAGKRSVSTQQAVDLVALAASVRHEAAAMRYLLENDGTFADIAPRWRARASSSASIASRSMAAAAATSRTGRFRGSTRTRRRRSSRSSSSCGRPADPRWPSGRRPTPPARGAPSSAADPLAALDDAPCSADAAPAETAVLWREQARSI
jgi:hypothetical protein